MKITPYRIKKGVLYLKHYGPKAFWNRLKDKMESERVPYGPWFERHKAGSIELRQQAKLSRKLEKPPVFSIVVPCYNPNLDYFFELMTSLHEQSYGYWQLCLADASTSSRVEDLARNLYPPEGKRRDSGEYQFWDGFGKGGLDWVYGP